MKFKRIAFQAVVPVPGASTFAFSDWLREFAAPKYEIVQAGDVVIVTHVESGTSYAYPWTHVAGGEPELMESESSQQSILDDKPVKRGKR